MRFEWVRADAFGPFARGEQLDLAPGMNVVSGPNEAGKSSWHAALYAGLCGVRRGQGRPAPADVAFEERRRPWSAGPDGDWRATVQVRLEGGRRVLVHQDLDAHFGSATDADLGEPMSVESTEKTLDGARLVGLTRKTFAATAWVRQAGILTVRDEADTLQEYLEKATSGAEDATVTVALDLLRKFTDDNVGTDRSPTKPLVSARRALDRTRDELRRAAEAHERYLDGLADVEQDAQRAQAAAHEVTVAEAALALREARAIRGRLDRARQLAVGFPGGEPPTAMGDEDLASDIVVALSAWEQMPALGELTGLSSAELGAQIAALPALPKADVEPDPVVQSAREALRDARRALQEHERTEPQADSAPPTGGASEADLRRAAFELGLAAPEPIAPPPSAVARWPRWAAAAGAATVLAGVMLVALAPPVGVVVVVAGLLTGVLAIAGFAVRHRGAQGDREAAAASAAALARQDQLRDWLQQAGLPVDPAALERLANQLQAAGHARVAYDRWEARRGELAGAGVRASDALATALRSRDAYEGGEPEEEAAAYERACRERAVLAASARRRGDLEAALAGRLAAEQAHAEVLAQREATEQAVLQAARHCSSDELTDAGAAVGVLRRWREQREGRVLALDDARRRWTDLQATLGDMTLAELEEHVRVIEQRSDRASTGLQPTAVTDYPLGENPVAHITGLRDNHRLLQRAVDTARGRLEAEAGKLPSVAEAEEAEADARAELSRVEQLRATLQQTQEFLTRADERVRRDIAPRLSATLSKRLPAVSADRYRDAIVNTRDLTVQVTLPDGSLRPAHLLSHGTAEQVYLLLRVGMTEILGDPGEPCPLILDDVTVQSDDVHTRAILDALHLLSQERQIVLFTQEASVLAWAEANLDSGRDRLTRLTPVA